MADTPAQAALRAAFDSKLSVIPQTLSSEQQTQAQTNMGGPFLPLTGGTVSGTITATGFSGPLTGNASTASAWETAITITVSGDATGSVSIDGADNAALNLTIANNSVTNEMLAADSVTFSKVDADDVATQAEAEAGASNSAFMTPLRVAQAIAAQGLNPNAYVIETYSNGSGWYRVWSDGLIEQGGEVYASESFTVVTFIKPFSSTPLRTVYNLAQKTTPYGNIKNWTCICDVITNVNMSVFVKDGNNVLKTGDGFWYAFGY